MLNEHQFERLRLSVGCVLNRVLSLTLQLVRYRVTREKDRGKSLGQCISASLLRKAAGPCRSRIISNIHKKYSSIVGSIEIH